VHVTSGAAIFKLALWWRSVCLHYTSTYRILFIALVTCLPTYRTMARYFEFVSQFYGFHLTHPRNYIALFDPLTLIYSVSVGYNSTHHHMTSTPAPVEDGHCPLSKVYLFHTHDVSGVGFTYIFRWLVVILTESWCFCFKIRGDGWKPTRDTSYIYG
jgi:hypothetical protein